MLYVIVCVVKEEGGNFNNQLRKEVWEKLRARSSKLPAHFTIKAPFEYESALTELEKVLEDFCKKEKATPFKMQGFDHFDNRTIYMKVNMSEEGNAMHDRLIDVMSPIPYIQFDKKDGKNKTFHVTVATKRLQPIYQEVWEYVNQYTCDFSALFDNICIFKWEESTWKLHKEFKI